MPRLLLVFLKEPIPGCVKTRLAADLGEEEATRIYRALVEVLLLQLRGLENCRIRFCYTPDDADDAIRFWILPYLNAQANGGDGADSYLIPAPDGSTQQPQEVDFSPQGKGDLGERLTRAFDQGFADGYSEIAVIGSDCPQCGARWINAAFSRLTA
ncbi:MAG: TIGR04282 family arsenosugar biosynthesis glycosyltransferase, partial [Akkermansiaceae bacterium]